MRFARCCDTRQSMRAHAGQALVVLSGVLVMAALSPALTFETLPTAWQQTLRKFHDLPSARGGGGDAAWTLDEDA